jgi:uncharacterized protein
MKTLVLGASTDKSRYSYLAANKLLLHKHEVVLIGREADSLGDHVIFATKPNPIDLFSDQNLVKELEGVDTVTIYLKPELQGQYLDFILRLSPRRVIFNPGTENEDMATAVRKAGIVVEEACTLVLLSLNEF